MPRPELRWPGRTARALSTGAQPGAPTTVTTIAADAAATVSFIAPASTGSGAITAYVVTPYIAGVAQSATTVPVGSLGAITGSNGNNYLTASVSGLTNSTAYTFTVRARNAFGDGPESGASGANTPLSGLVFGDDFNGPANGAIDPEWYVYNRCGYIAQSEVEWYLPGQVTLDGSSNLLLTATKTAHSGPSYPSDGNTTRNQTWLSGAVQSNTKTWAPSVSTNTMTFEARQQICPDVATGLWPGLFWLVGQDFLTAWKTDPNQPSWNTTGKCEIDIAEWNPPNSLGTTNYGNNCYTSGSGSPSGFTNLVSTATDFSAAMHVFTCKWKPGVSVTWLTDASQTNTETSNVPASGAQFMLLIYLQILAGAATATQSCKIDYIRVYDQNLG